MFDDSDRLESGWRAVSELTMPLDLQILGVPYANVDCSVCERDQRYQRARDGREIGFRIQRKQSL